MIHSRWSAQYRGSLPALEDDIPPYWLTDFAGGGLARRMPARLLAHVKNGVFAALEFHDLARGTCMDFSLVGSLT